jgi:hypothetical protein
MIFLNGVNRAVTEDKTLFQPNLTKVASTWKGDFPHTSCLICQYVIYFTQGHAGLKKNAVILPIVQVTLNLTLTLCRNFQNALKELQLPNGYGFLFGFLCLSKVHIIILFSMIFLQFLR